MPPPVLMVGVEEPPRAVGVGGLDGHHTVPGVYPLSLAGGAKIVVGTHEAFEADSIDGTVAAIADHPRVERRGLILTGGRGFFSLGFLACLHGGLLATGRLMWLVTISFFDVKSEYIAIELVQCLHQFFVT